MILLYESEVVGTDPAQDLSQAAGMAACAEDGAREALWRRLELRAKCFLGQSLGFLGGNMSSVRVNSTGTARFGRQGRGVADNARGLREADDKRVFWRISLRESSAINASNAAKRSWGVK